MSAPADGPSLSRIDSSSASAPPKRKSKAPAALRSHLEGLRREKASPSAATWWLYATSEKVLDVRGEAVDVLVRSCCATVYS